MNRHVLGSRFRMLAPSRLWVGDFRVPKVRATVVDIERPRAVHIRTATVSFDHAWPLVVRWSTGTHSDNGIGPFVETPTRAEVALLRPDGALYLDEVSKYLTVEDVFVLLVRLGRFGDDGPPCGFRWPIMSQSAMRRTLVH
jgi:hypothetical protein